MKTARTHAALAILLASHSLSCGNKQEPAPATNPAPPAEYGEEWYGERGFPSPQQTWAAGDYLKAAEAVTVLGRTQAGRERVPRLAGQGASPALFAAMISNRNTALLTSPALPLVQRIKLTVGWLPALSKLMQAYWGLREHLSGSSNELAALQAYMVEATLAVAVVSQDFAASLAPDHPSYDARMNGLRKLQESWADTVDGAVRSFMESHLYSDEDRLNLATALRGTLPKLCGRIPPARTEAVKKRLEAIIRSSEEPRIAAALRALLTDISPQDTPPSP